MFEGLSQYRYKKRKETLLNGKFELIQVAGKPTSLISLPNGNLVCSTTGSVILLDENIKEIKSVSTGGINCCDLNRRNEIYVSVQDKRCIIWFDLNLNKLNQFGSEGAGNNQFNYPWGLCCHGDYLFICDSENMRIQILTLDFDYVNTIQQPYGVRPYYVQTSETTIGVCCGGATFFFDLKTRVLKFKHNNYATHSISYISSIFYGSNYYEKKFYFFDSDGNFKEEMAMNERLSPHITYWTDGFCRHKDILYLADNKQSKILKFIE